MPSRAHGLLLSALAASAAFGCVSADAGYAGVRELTAARLQKDVRWYRHEASSAGAEHTKKLLADPLTADTAVQIALLNNRGLQADFEQLGIARARLVQALRVPNPTADAALRYHTRGETRPELELQGMFALSELLFLPLRGGAASARAEAAKLSVAGRVLDLAFDTRVAFYDYQAAAQLLELRSSILAALRASFEAAQSLHEAGNMTDLSFASERALYEEARVAVTRAEATLLARRAAVNALLGVWGRDVQWTAEERLADPRDELAELSTLESRALERSLELEIIERRFEAASKSANVARLRGWLPELRAGVSAEREHDDELGWTVGPAVGLELPLFYQGQGETDGALAERRQQQGLYANTAVRIRATARALVSRLQAAAKSAVYYRNVLLPLRQQLIDDTQLQYNAMTIGVFQLLQAKRDQIETARAYVELLHEYWVLRAEVDQLSAGRLPRADAFGQVAPDEQGEGEDMPER
jgi:cobalt-zinc-cadmium efflux system outer membrane protein